MEDSLGDRIWVDLEACKKLVDNIGTLFQTKPYTPGGNAGTGGMGTGIGTVSSTSGGVGGGGSSDSSSASGRSSGGGEGGVHGEAGGEGGADGRQGEELSMADIEVDPRSVRVVSTSS